MPYESAHDLPSFVTLEQQLNGLRLLRFLLPRDQRALFKEIQGQVRLLGDTVDSFYAVLGPRNWIFHEDLPVEQIGGLISKAPDAAEAERQLISYYMQPNNLRFLILRLRRFEALRRRLHLIERPQVDYLGGRHYACTLVLLTVMDGFVNEVDAATRRGLHGREPEDFDVYDRVISHHHGLSHAHRTFRQSRYTTSDEPVYELHRNGILHGMLTNYDNDVVATKAWNRMFAVADWAAARLKEPKPPEKRPSWSEIWRTFADLARQRQATEAWRPSTLEPPDAGFAEDGCRIACEEYLRLWGRRNYGNMAKMLYAAVQKGYGAATPRQVRQEYADSDLFDWKILRVDHVAPAICMVDVRLILKDRDTRQVRLRWIYETADGDPAVLPLAGEWHLVVWGPAAFMSPANDDDES